MKRSKALLSGAGENHRPYAQLIHELHLTSLAALIYRLSVPPIQPMFVSNMSRSVN